MPTYVGNQTSNYQLTPELAAASGCCTEHKSNAVLITNPDDGKQYLHQFDETGLVTVTGPITGEELKRICDNATVNKATDRFVMMSSYLTNNWLIPITWPGTADGCVPVDPPCPELRYKTTSPDFIDWEWNPTASAWAVCGFAPKILTTRIQTPNTTVTEADLIEGATTPNAWRLFDTVTKEFTNQDCVPVRLKFEFDFGGDFQSDEGSRIYINAFPNAANSFGWSTTPTQRFDTRQNTPGIEIERDDSAQVRAYGYLAPQQSATLAVDRYVLVGEFFDGPNNSRVDLIGASYHCTSERTCL